MDKTVTCTIFAQSLQFYKPLGSSYNQFLVVKQNSQDFIQSS